MRSPPRETIRINGAEFLVPYRLQVGQSFFIPALNYRKTISVVSPFYRRKGYKMTYQERIEVGVLGIRAWRVA